MSSMMKCGHKAHGENQGKPVCVVCFPAPEACEPVEIDFTGREAICYMCQKRVKSSVSVSFINHQPDRATDIFYCGCRGWG